MSRKKIIGLGLFVGVLSFFPGLNALAHDANISSPELASLVAFHTMKYQVKEARCERCWFLGFGAGAVVPTTQNKLLNVDNGTGFPSPYNTDQYSVTNNTTSAVLSLMGGYRWLMRRSWLHAVFVGADYRYIIDHTLSGNISLENTPLFNNLYTYTANDSSHVITLFSKIEPWKWGDFAPYVSVGAGFSLNNFNGYAESPAPNVVTPRTSPAYPSKTTVGFAYEAGFGLDYYVRPLMIVSAGCDYLNYGSLASGATTSTYSNSSLNFGNLSATTYFVSLNYIMHS